MITTEGVSIDKSKVVVMLDSWVLVGTTGNLLKTVESLPSHQLFAAERQLGLKKLPSFQST